MILLEDQLWSIIPTTDQLPAVPNNDYLSLPLISSL